jgi:hypothetical protein
MSDQQGTGGDTSLEEVFLSREFGRASSRGISSVGRSEDPAQPPQLEEVFLSEAFGHPEAVTAVTPGLARPPLAVVAGSGEDGRAERDTTRYRAIAAVSGVAAAALVVAGIAVGSGPSSKSPTQSAQGKQPGGTSTGPTGGAPGPAGAPTPNSSGGTPAPGGAPAATFASGGGNPTAELTSATTPAPASPTVVVEVPPGTTVEVVPTAPPAGPGGGAGGSGGSGGTPPGTSTGGGSVLTPLLVVVGDTVATVGTTVTSASGGLGTALPVISPVTGVLGSLGVTVSDLGHAVAGTTT